MALRFLRDGTFTGSVSADSYASTTDAGININGITLSRVAANSAIRVGDGLETLGLLRSYANLIVATTGSFGGSVTVGSGLGAVATDGVLQINGGSGSGGEAYLNLTRGGSSGFILNHTATAIQVRATANIPMFFYTNDTLSLKINANNTISLPTYGAGYLKTSASGLITADSTVPGTGTFLPLAGGTLTGGLIGTTVKYNTQLSTNDLMGQKAFIGISSSLGAEKFKIYKNTNTTDGYARFKIDRAFDYGNSDQMVQEAIFQRRTTTKNFVFRYDGDISTSDDVYLEVYELSNGQVEIWLCADDYAQPVVEVISNPGTSEIFTSPSAGTPTGTLIHSSNPDTETPNWNSHQGVVTATTFSGDLNGTINTATTGTTQTAGNNSTLIATTAYADAAAGAVPIGNYLPLSAGSSYPLTGALHTDGTIFMSAGNPGIIMQETDVTDKNWDIQVNGGNLKFYEVNDARSVFSEKVTFKAGGNVGIGETDPKAPLNIKGVSLNPVVPTATSSSGILRIESGNGGVGLDIGSQGSAPYSMWMQVGNTSNNTGDVYPILLNPLGGNVGIGTISPGDKLTIEDSGSAVISIYSTDTGSQSVPKTFLNLYGENTAAQKRLQAQIASSPGHNASNAGELQFFTSDSSSVSQQRMTIREDGNVGINITAPTHKLDVDGVVRARQGQLIGANVFTDEAQTAFFTNGTADLNVDIVLPNASLWGYLEVDVTGFYNNQDAHGKLTKIYAMALNVGGTIFNTESRISDAVGPVNANVNLGPIRWDSTTSTYRIRLAHIVSSGNNFAVKISAFTISGKALSLPNSWSLSPLYTESTAGLTQQYVYYNNRLGIGTSTPSALLDIQGTQGQLFSVTDNLSGSIFAVADISGVPILDVNSSGLVTVDGNLYLPDNKKILLGTGNDLEIYHDASHSYIKDIGVGDLKISSNTVRIESNAAENMIIAIANGGVSSYYNNVKKFETDVNGVTVTGAGTFTGNVDLGDSSNITMGVGAPGQLKVKGSGYTGAIALDATAMYIYHDSSLRDLILGTNEATRLTIAGSNGNATFTGTVTSPTFLGDLNGTINTVTTAVTKPNATDDNTVATTAFVKNLIAELPAGLIYKGTWDADTNTPTLAAGGGEISEGTTTTVTADKLIDSAATFTTDGVAVGDRARVENVNGVSYALVTSVDSQTQLTLDANIVVSTTEVYIIETPAFLEEGNYYIVSVDGATDLNGITDWKVGDWVVAASTNVWQKIDNSSVLDGEGTGQTIPLWSGSGDSNTLTNSNIKQDSGGNIGIGPGTIVSPPQDLGLTIQSDTTTSRLVLKNTSTGVGANDGFRIGAIGTDIEFETVDSGDYQFFTGGGAAKFIIKNSGYVGIGTIDPNYSLDVNGIIRSENSSEVGTLYLGNIAQGQIPGGAIIGQRSPNYTSTGNLLFQVPTWGAGTDYGLTTQMSIEVKGSDTKEATISMIPFGGKVGLGTTSPVAMFQVGSITATAMSQVVGKARIVGTNYIPSATQMGTLDIASTTRNSSSPWNQGFGPSLTFSQSISGYVNGYEVVLGAIKTISTQTGNTGQEAAMTFLVNGGTSTGLVERMRIAEDGNVGIGTTTPSQGNLVISPTAQSADLDGLVLAYNPDGATNRVRAQLKIDNFQGILELTNSSDTVSTYITAAGDSYFTGGDVGIGTDSPTTTLSVKGTSSGGINVIGVGTTATRCFLGLNSANKGYLFITGSSGENPAVITSQGDSYISTNLGVGTTVPSEKLDVDGDVRVRNLTAGIVTSSATGVLSTGGPTPMNMSLGEGYAGNIREKYYRTNKTVYPSAIGSQYAQLIQQGILNSMSLIMSPIATETAVVSSPAPNNGSGDFSFNRNSPGSRVGSDGYIVRETQNLFIQSNDMSASSAWTLGDATLTGGQTGYTGAPNAWRLNDNAANAGHIIRQTPGYGGTVTVSIYAKAGTKDYLYIRGVTQGASNQYTYFKLTDGTLGTVQGITAFMEAAGGGWYRCSVTYDHNPAYEYYFGMTNTDNSPNYAGDGTGNIFFMNPQLENGMGAREYIPTTTVVKYAGITTNVPRIDYLNNIPELLIEPSSTNVVYDGSHMRGTGNVTESYTLSPEGIINGIKINEIANSGQHYGYVEASVVAGVQYFLSFYIKKGTESTVTMYTQNNAIASSATINLDNGTISVSGGTEGFIYEVGGGWYRAGYKTPAAIVTASSTDIYLPVKDLSSYTGNVNNYTEYYGVQLETSSILTSLIQTYAGAVTRAQEQISLANMNANNIAGNATSGTLMMEFSNHYNGIGGDTIRFHQSSTIIGRGYLYIRQMGFADTWGSAGLAVTDNVLSKGIWRLNSLTDGSFFLNGVKGNNVSGTAWGDIGKIVVYGNYGTMRIRNIFFAPLALTDTQCVTLTTINE